MRLTRPNPPELTTLLTAAEVAKLLRMSRKAVYAMHARGELPGVVRLGARRLRFERNALLSWLSRKRAPSPAGEPR